MFELVAGPGVGLPPRWLTPAMTFEIPRGRDLVDNVLPGVGNVDVPRYRVDDHALGIVHVK